MSANKEDADEGLEGLSEELAIPESPFPYID